MFHNPIFFTATAVHFIALYYVFRGDDWASRNIKVTVSFSKIKVLSLCFANILFIYVKINKVSPLSVIAVLIA